MIGFKLTSCEKCKTAAIVSNKQNLTFVVISITFYQTYPRKCHFACLITYGMTAPLSSYKQNYIQQTWTISVISYLILCRRVWNGRNISVMFVGSMSGLRGPSGYTNNPLKQATVNVNNRDSKILQVRYLYCKFEIQIVKHQNTIGYTLFIKREVCGYVLIQEFQVPAQFQIQIQITNHPY